MYLHRIFFSTYNLQLYWKWDTGIYSFLWVLRNFLGTPLLWKSPANWLDSRLFLYSSSISSSTEVFWGASDLLCSFNVRIFILLYQTKNMLFVNDSRKIVFLKKILLSVLKKVWSSTKHVEKVNGASYWCIYH